MINVGRFWLNAQTVCRRNRAKKKLPFTFFRPIRKQNFRTANLFYFSKHRIYLVAVVEHLIQNDSFPYFRTFPYYLAVAGEDIRIVAGGNLIQYFDQSERIIFDKKNKKSIYTLLRIAILWLLSHLLLGLGKWRRLKIAPHISHNPTHLIHCRPSYKNTKNCIYSILTKSMFTAFWLVEKTVLKKYTQNWWDFLFGYNFVLICCNIPQINQATP